MFHSLTAGLYTFSVLLPFLSSATPGHTSLPHRPQAQHHETHPKQPTSQDGSVQYCIEDLYSMTIDFLDSFIWPNNKRQTDSVNSTFFAEGVLGRVDVTRNFVGRELNTEYIYGLFSTIRNNPDPSFFTMFGEPVGYKLAHWTGAGNVVSFANINYIQVSAVNRTVPFETDCWLTFDENRQISQYDATFRNLQWAFDSMIETGMNEFGITNATFFQNVLQQKLVTSICSIAQSNCNGTNQQYDSYQDCENFLSRQVRFGKTYEMGMNTLLCRMVHQGMVPIRPNVHCPHIGKTGGAYCVDDRQYEQVVNQPYFTTSDFIANGLPGNGNL